ncbi:MAG: FadR/GntR family transcriptional regulator [Devosia sp.]|nr:FadR/GntR family transcriptional regulator [Devosia sp.]
MELRRVTRLTSTQSVAQQLLELIRNGTWKSGDILPSEKQLVEQLGVGRSTVREALQNLAALNIVEASSGHRTVVKTPSAAEIFRTDVLGFLIGNTLAQELLEAREMIEPDCVRLAVERATDDDLAGIDALLDEHEARHLANQPVAEYGALFHIRLAEASHNRVAASFMASILHIMKERGRRIDDIPNARRKEIDDHRRILELVKARNPDASEAMRRHILEWSDTYFEPAL